MPEDPAAKAPRPGRAGRACMTALRDIGRAKINLTLEVLGRRADGFHELKSLVAFANFGDRLALDPGDSLDLEVEGPFAAALGPGNLILEAGRAARARVPRSEEHTSELQSLRHLVCRLLLEKKKH